MLSIKLASSILIPEVLQTSALEHAHNFFTDEKNLSKSETTTPKALEIEFTESFEVEGLCNKLSDYQRCSLQNSTVSTNVSANFSRCSESLLSLRSIDSKDDNILEKNSSGSLICLDEQTVQSLEASAQSVQELSRPTQEFTDNRLVQFSPALKVRDFPKNTEDKRSIIKDQKYQHIIPTFDSQGADSLYLSFLNKNKTAIHHSGTRFSTIIGSRPLPDHGRFKFSIRVEDSSKVHPRLYIGIVTSDLKNRGLGYRPGSYFISTFSQQAYLNGLKSIDASAFAKKGQEISVLIDINRGWIGFEIEGNRVIEGKISLPRRKHQGFYPCVCLGENEGRVSFI